MSDKSSNAPFDSPVHVSPERKLKMSTQTFVALLGVVAAGVGVWTATSVAVASNTRRIEAMELRFTIAEQLLYRIDERAAQIQRRQDQEGR